VTLGDGLLESGDIEKLAFDPVIEVVEGVLETLTKLFKLLEEVIGGIGKDKLLLALVRIKV
jgi:hypothetical protein